MPEKIILGIDEVGRGPWAGPLVIGAVILGGDFKNLPEYAELTDSKKLTAKKREALNDVILAQATATGLGWVKPVEIDRYGLSASLKLAARRAIKPILTQIKAHQVPNFDEIIIDGTINLLSDTLLKNKVVLLPKADFLVKEVSAASIIAKVAHDHYMTEISGKYPEYGFEKHVGYGTKAHKIALEKYGICPEHRLSFRPVAQIALAGSHGSSIATPPESALNRPETPKSTISARNTTATGQKAEKIIANYLEQHQNHTIIAQNHKTKTYEIDLISVRDQSIYFTEVKYRQNSAHGAPIERITPTKLAQMHYAAEKFLATHPEFRDFQPFLAAASVKGPDFTVTDWLILD